MDTHDLSGVGFTVESSSGVDNSNFGVVKATLFCFSFWLILLLTILLLTVDV
jgi:hypothetical protein